MEVVRIGKIVGAAALAVACSSASPGEHAASPAPDDETRTLPDASAPDGPVVELGGELGCEDDCRLGEKCSSDGKCVSCGDEGRRISYRSVDGKPVEDCKGCGCSDWYVLGCYQANEKPYAYPKPWIDLYWWVGYEQMHWAIAADGTVFDERCDESMTCSPTAVRVVSADVAPGGRVEINILRTVEKTDAEGVKRWWWVEGHVVATCPQ